MSTKKYSFLLFVKNLTFITKSDIIGIMKNKLEIIRKQKGLTQLELAERVGVTQPHISNMEKGDRDIDIEMLVRIAHALGVKAYELLPDDEQPESLTPEEKQFIDLLRKSKNAPAEQPTTTKAG